MFEGQKIRSLGGMEIVSSRHEDAVLEKRLHVTAFGTSFDRVSSSGARWNTARQCSILSPLRRRTSLIRWLDRKWYTCQIGTTIGCKVLAISQRSGGLDNQASGKES